MQQAVTHNENNDEIEISLADIAKALYDGRWFIVLGTVVCVLLALGGAFVTAKYKSSSSWYFDGLVKVSGESGESGISIAKYNRIMDSAKTLERFETYLQSMKLPALPEIDLLRKLFASRDGIGAQIKPFRSSLVESKLSKDTQNAPILGVTLEVSANSRELSHAALVLLSSYLSDSLLYDFYHDSLLDNYEKYKTLDARNENKLIELKLKRPHLERQQAVVETLVEKYSRFFEANRSAETLITTEDTLGSSPIVKLMGLQLDIAALDAQVQILQREEKQNNLFLDFYQQALELHDKSKSSVNFFKQLPQLLPTAFAGKDLNDEVTREAYNKLLLATEAAQNLYERSGRLLVKPSLPGTPTTRFGLVGAAALLAGLMLSCLLVLIRSWWKEVTTAS